MRTTVFYLPVKHVVGDSGIVRSRFTLVQVFVPILGAVSLYLYANAKVVEQISVHMTMPPLARVRVDIE